MNIRIFVLLATWALLSGCSGGDDTEQAEATSGSGSSGYGDCELPAEYSELPLVPECFHISDYDIAIQASTTLSQEDALEFFETALPEHGWDITKRKEMNEGLIHLGLEGHGVRSAYVEVSARDSADDNTIGVTYYVN